jgi:microsomal dipeptidase-like Zn-dependent dipeptidase
MRKIFFTVVSLFILHRATAQEIREFMDLQIHTTMHTPYHFFGKGLVYFSTSNPPPLSFKHKFKNVNYANYLENNKGARIIINGAINKEWIHSKKKARRKILQQIEYVNEFAKNHSENFAVAKSPQEVRYLEYNTNKTIIIHSIEGGRRLINSQEDANFWASQGVAFITLIHLIDDENGGAAIAHGLFPHLINLKGLLSREKNRRLTEHGKQAIRYLANAGIMTDITHMSDVTRKDALDFMIANHIIPISTHDGFKPIQNNPRAISEADIVRIYQHNGFISLPISGESLRPYKPYPVYKNSLDSMKRLNCYCNGSIDSYQFTYLAVKKFIENNAAEIANDTTVFFSNLNESQKVNYSIGFQTDFNGWLNHHRPRYGKKGCSPLPGNKTFEEIELKGLAHPGLLNSHWNLLVKEGVDIEPVKRASEKFLQLWQIFIDNRRMED